MPQTGAAESRRSDRNGDSLPPPIVGFDPVGEVTAFDNRPSTRRHVATASDSRPSTRGHVATASDNRPSTRGQDGTASHRMGEESRAATRAAMAEAFAAEFGVDEESPSAASLADRFGFRFEESASGPAGRRTVTITGHGTERSVPPAERSVRRGGGETRRRGGRFDAPVGLHADRAALWAVGLALVLALVAAMSAHGLPVH